MYLRIMFMRTMRIACRMCMCTLEPAALTFSDKKKTETTKLNYDLHLPNPNFRLQRFHIPQDNRSIFGSSQKILRLLRHHHACNGTVMS